MSGYRPEIDGLRAIAVLSVILFHLGYSVFAGGFVGVDIFFVISGYLITKIIVEEKTAQGSFRFFRFYMRRVRRLMPSLLLIIALSLLAAKLMLPQDLQADFAGSAIHALVSLSNIFFWANSGYFDADAGLRPLLHTWSLGVEEQFYFFWPALLVICLSAPKLGRRGALAVLLGLGAASFAFGEVFLNRWAPESLLSLSRDPESAVFYLTPFRVFEFVIGAVVNWAPKTSGKKPIVDDIVSLLGVGLMAYGVFAIAEHMRFPSYNALIPSAGAAMVIWAQNARWVNAVLASPPASYIGRISYTLYLVHWPVLVYYGYWRAAPLTSVDTLIVSAAIFAVSALIYHLVENPLRRPSPKRPALSGSAFGLACCVAALALMYLCAGLFGGGRSAPDLAGMDDPAAYEPGAADATAPDDARDQSGWTALDADAINSEAAKSLFTRACMLQAEMTDARAQDGDWICNMHAPLQILTIGNSHERAAYSYIRNAFRDAFRDGDMNIVYGSMHSQGRNAQGKINSCNFHKNGGPPFKSYEPACAWLAAYMADQATVAAAYDVIVVGALRPLDWGSIYIDYASALQKLNPKLKIVILGTLVHLGNYRCIDIANQNNSAEACADNDLVAYYNPGEEADIKARWPGLEFFYVDRREMLCGDGDYASCDIYQDGKPIFFDASHFNWLAAIKLLDVSERSGVLRALEDHMTGGVAPAE